LYRHRLTKELHHRKLAAEQIQKEARECTYIPFTNHVRQKLTSTSSLSGIAHRERTIEIARERFNQGNMCVECLKNVEISTGTYVLNDEILANEHIISTTQSLPISPTHQSKGLPPNQIEFRIAPKQEMSVRATGQLPPAGKPVQEEESRNDDIPEESVQQHSHSGREISPVKTSRDENTGFDDIRPPREILVPSPVADEKKRASTKSSLNRFGFPGPSPTSRTKKLAGTKSGDKPATPTSSLPPRVSTPTHTAFSFDVAVSPIPSSEEPPKVETMDSHLTPILKNTVVEDSVEQLLLESPSRASTVSSGTPLRLDSYVSIDVVPETPCSVPYDEKLTNEDNVPTSNPANKDFVQVESETAMQEETTSPSVSPLSKESESMRRVSILDREDSFNGSIFVTVVSTKEADNHVASVEVEQKDNWTEQVTKWVACDGAAAAKKSGSSNIINDEENAEQQAADRAYNGCDVDAADMECIDLTDETDAAADVLVPEEQHVAKETSDDNGDVPFDEKDEDFKDHEKTIKLEREAWLEQATEWAAYEKSASPTPTEEVVSSDEVNNGRAGTLDKQAMEEETKSGIQGEVTFAPTDEQVFFGDQQSRSSAGDKSSVSEPFFGGSSQNSGDKSTACSTVALTEDSNCDGHTRGLTESVRTSEGDFDEMFDRLTDCITCWKLEPWPVVHQK
jgi:hypothetical protein